MLAIRLQRNGRKALPLYRIVVQEAQRHPLSGRIVAQVGSYNPHTKETVIDKKAVEKYLSTKEIGKTKYIGISAAFLSVSDDLALFNTFTTPVRVIKIRLNG